MTSPIYYLFTKELKRYFSSSLAFIFILLFLVLSNISAFYFVDILGMGQADLQPFFYGFPFIFIFFIPALSMGIWSEERKIGTFEMLRTLPLTDLQLILGKFFASWAFASIAIMGTFPLWATIAFLGDPDHGLIINGYMTTFMMAGGFLSLCHYLSICTKNQVIAFIIGGCLCFLTLITGLPIITKSLSPILSQNMIENLGYLSSLNYFEKSIKGLVSLDVYLYFSAMIILGIILLNYKLKKLYNVF